MIQNACRSFVFIAFRRQNIWSFTPSVPGVRRLQVSVARLSEDGVKDKEHKQSFDTSLLEFLVCPLSKKPLRYDEKTNELINEELGISYPIIDGIPNLIPQDARMIGRDSQKK
nr:PREDICTED: protein preY, mitochondrial [Lepisosteus oculatus]